MVTPGRISLNGADWQCKGYYGEDWRWRDAHRPTLRDTRHWLPASVPGSVHHDLWRAGEISNPYFERNSLLLEWVPARTWVYRKTFTVDPAIQGGRVQLIFEGVDYEAEFFLNGESLGTHTGMFTPAMFEIGDRLHYGAENTLAVVIEPAPPEQPQVGRTSRVRTHKSRMTYWWDFCPRMIHLGIWDNVFLEVSGPTRIEDVFVRPQLAPGLRQANVSVSIMLDSRQHGIVEVETLLRLDSATIAMERTCHALAPGQTCLNVCLPVVQPQLWWPNGHGEQPLYEAEVRITDAETGLLSDVRTTRFGIRQVKLIPNEGAEATARPYTLVVNGRRIYIKGWNWVPLDVLYGVPRPEKLAHLLGLARQAQVNLLRVWGGGLIETEAFYNRCDELGIMVWQEFIQSSSGIDNTPPDSPEYIARMVHEAEQIIPRRRNHPALILWCGGNELTLGPEQPADDDQPLLAALKATVARLDPDRLWLPTSPSGRLFSYSLANSERDPQGLHDVHGPWEYQGVEGQCTLYNRGASLLHSEFGVEGLTNLKTLQATIAPEHRWPVTLDSPVWHHLGAWWVHQPTWQAVFGEIGDLETLVRATQLMQAEGLRYALEADRRRKYRNSGTLPWQFNEPYPMAACTSAVDYYGRPKPAYYAVAHAYAPLQLSARFPTLAWAGRENFEAGVWLHNALETPVSDARLTARLIDLDGSVRAEWSEVVSAPADAATPLLSVAAPLTRLDSPIFFLDLTLDDSADGMVAASRYVFTRAANLAPLLAAPPTTLDVRQKGYSDTWMLAITNTGSQTALFVWLEDGRAVTARGYATFSTNHVCLFPAETCEVAITWQGVPPQERCIEISALNARRLALLPRPEDRR